MNQKDFQKVVKYAHQAGHFSINESLVKERYEEYIKRHGQEKANIAIKNTIENFKKIARQEEKRLFAQLKEECLKKYSFSPANKRTLIDDLKKLPVIKYYVYDMPATQEYIKRFLKCEIKEGLN